MLSTFFLLIFTEIAYAYTNFIKPDISMLVSCWLVRRKKKRKKMEGRSCLKPIIFVYFLACFFSGNKQVCEGKERAGAESGIHGVKKMRGMFVFGSSLVDNGNNNLIKNSIAKANYLPYGIDFPLGSSGRFTNGKNVVDLLGDFLELPSFIPAFYDPATKGKNIVNGVNYASGGSGILDNTGSFAGKVVSLREQIANFEEVTLPELGFIHGGLPPLSVVGDYLFLVGSGGNDYSLNYFLFRSSLNISLRTFTVNLTASLSLQLKKLHSLGGRKFVIMGVNPLGCSPVARRGRKKCNTEMNMAARLFNLNLKTMVDEIRPQMPGSTLVFVNSYKILKHIINFPTLKGFKDSKSTCCEVTKVSEGGNGILCKRGGQTCPNRKDYVFFDGLHPTEAVNLFIAKKAFSSQFLNEVYPTNVQNLTKI